MQVPAAYEQAFVASPPSVPSAAPPIPPFLPSPPTANVTPSTPARERAEWLWRLANGSLLVPFLLALVVMYYGVAMLKDVRGLQNEALKPVLEHQLKLLEEDRRRMFREASTPTPSVPATSTPTK